MRRFRLGCLRTFLCFAVLGTVLGRLPSGAWAASNSKLGIHLIHNNTAGVTQICNARPRVIKVLDVHGPMLTAARNYKAATPDGIVVLRIYTTRRYTLADDPTQAGNDFFDAVLAPAINSLSPADRAGIDYLEGPNEGDSTPCWGTLQDAQWFNTFWLALSPRIGAAGFKPCGFSIPVGNPPGSLSEMQQKLAAIVPALRDIKQRGGSWGYHAYTPIWSTDVGYQLWYSLRYRQFYSYFAQSYPDLVDLPLILTEAGFDSGGSPTGSGWQANGTASQYQNWLTWWDAQIRQDSYVLGSTIFQIGSPQTWPSFDLEPIAGWLADYLIANTGPKLVCSPASLSASVVQGSNASPASFTVRNAAANTMNYTISSNVGWLTVNPTSGASSGETDTIIVNFAASGLAAGNHAGTITVSAPGADDSPQSIDVAVSVQPRPIPGDLNSDRCVDRHDVIIFLSCITGPANGPPPTGCALADIDADDDVDQADFGLLQRCILGEGIPGDPDCAEPG